MWDGATAVDVARDFKMAILSKKFIFKFSAVAIPTIFTVLAVIATQYVQKSYENTENDLIKKETEFVSFELAENLRRNIAYRVKVLEIVAKARPDIFPHNEKYFKKTIPVIIDNLPGFFAINWVDTSGVIRWIYPLKNNESALGKNVLERKDVTHYLAEARDTKQPTISHAIDLYQGPKGLILYVPIYDGNTFKGWYNGVISINDMLDRFFERRKLHNIAVSVKWKGHDDYVYKYGSDSSGTAELEFESNVLNQKLMVSVDSRRASVIEARKERLHKIFIVVYILIALIALFTFYIIRTQFTLMGLNRALSRDKTLLNILVHDMATPLTLISENIGRLKEKLKDTNFAEVDRIMRASDKQKDLLLRVRSFHASNMGKIKLDLVPVSAMELIEETIALFEDPIRKKQIKIQIEKPSKEVYCLTDRITAVNNVLGNVLANAIKFSEDKCTIVIRAINEKQWVIIEVQDSGTGISDEILKNLFAQGEMTSTKGTKGEAGTGLGMLQIKAFMDLYKGKIKIHTSEKGTTVRLFFRSTDVV